jgi:hypothetical protein
MVGQAWLPPVGPSVGPLEAFVVEPQDAFKIEIAATAKVQRNKRDAIGTPRSSKTCFAQRTREMMSHTIRRGRECVESRLGHGEDEGHYHIVIGLEVSTILKQLTKGVWMFGI